MSKKKTTLFIPAGIFAIFLISIGITHVWAETPREQTIREAIEQANLIRQEVEVELNKDLETSANSNDALFVIYSNTKWSGGILDTSKVKREFNGEGHTKISFTCKPDIFYFINFKKKTDGYMAMGVMYKGTLINEEIVSDTNTGVDLRGKCFQKKVYASDMYTTTEYFLGSITDSILSTKIPEFTPDNIDNDLQDQLADESNHIKDHAILLLYSNSYWSGSLRDSGGDSSTIDGRKVQKIPFECLSGGVYSMTFQNKNDWGYLVLAVIQDGKLLDSKATSADYGVVSLVGKCQPSTFLTLTPQTGKNGGGCLIATAAFGSELAPQVQMLRELRDNTLLKTSSGSTFITGFNSIYYSFAPTVADWERQNSIFKEIVRATVTPLITTLSILNYVNINSEAKMLVYGISIILLNVGMYFVAPAFVIFRLKKRKN